MEEDQLLADAEEGLLVKESLTVDEMLRKWVGEFGRAQWIHFGLCSFAWALEAMHTLVMVFVDNKGRNNTNLTGKGWFKCSSTVQEFHLGGFQVGLARSAFFLGAQGAHVFGGLSDGKLGRKGTLFMAVFISGVLGIMTAFAPSFWVYVLLRFATGASSAGGIGLVSFVLGTECIGPRHRGVVGMSTLYFFSMGTLLLVGLSYLAASSWRLVYILTSIPSLIYAFGVLLPFVDESPRWLMIKGRKSEAMKVLGRMASSNKRLLPPDVTLSDTTGNSEGNVKKTGSITHVVCEPLLRWRLLVITCIWFVASVVYYGVSLNVSNLEFNVYTSVTFNSLMEMPAFALTALLLSKIGRRAMLVGALLWAATFCAIGSLVYWSDLVPQSWVGLTGSACGAFSMFGIAAAYNLLYIYSVELFPTVVRNAATGAASGTGNFGAILSPIIVQLSAVHPASPFFIFAVACIVGGLLAFLLPETLDQPLFETIESMKAQDSSLREPLLADPDFS